MISVIFLILGISGIIGFVVYDTRKINTDNIVHQLSKAQQARTYIEDNPIEGFEVISGDEFDIKLSDCRRGRVVWDDIFHGKYWEISWKYKYTGVTKETFTIFLECDTKLISKDLKKQYTEYVTYTNNIINDIVSYGKYRHLINEGVDRDDIDRNIYNPKYLSELDILHRLHLLFNNTL